MKKIFVMAVAALAAVLSSAASADAAKLKVIATIFPQYDFTREIAGDSVELTMLLRPGTESHTFDPTPRDIKRIAACDLFIYVGGASDEWARNILASLPPESRERVRVVSLMDIVEPVEEKLVEGMQDEEEEGDEPEYDEHVWTSPKNAARIVTALTEILCEMDGANAATYRANSSAYLARLAELDKKFTDITQNAKRRVIIFGDRFPFRYFADAYGLDYYAAFPGCSTETEASAATIAFLIDKVKAEKIPVVFYREFSNEKIALAIGEGSGARAALLHSCHNVARDEFESGATYLKLMSRNAEILREALN
jgi:zinc transport system substrate-binding protein